MSAVTPRPRFSLPLAIPFAVGLVLLAVTLFTVATTLAFVSRAERAEAGFVGSEARVGGNHGGTFLYPSFAFRTKDGQRIVVRSTSGSTDQPYADGQAAAVLYLPSEPEAARLDSFVDLWAGSTATAIAGVLLTGIPAAVFVGMRRRARHGGGMNLAARST